MEIEGIEQFEAIIRKVVMEVLSEIRPLPMPDESNSEASNSVNNGINGGGNGGDQNSAIQTGYHWIPSHCCQVTEIIIRVGTPAAVQTLGGPPCVPCLPYCPPSFMPSAYLDAENLLSKEDKELIQKIIDITRDTPEGLLNKLLRDIGTRQLSRNLRNFATSLGIKP
jgi:hypothetical protein